MIHKSIKLSTSNLKKIEEFKRFGLTFDIVNGKDIKEVLSDIDNVIIYKTLDSENNVLVEDTVLIVDNEEIVDIRWKIKEISEKINPKIEWIVSLGIKDNEYLYIYRGFINCDFINVKNIPDDAFGFDPYIKPKNSDMSFYNLNKLNLKDSFSPRKLAVNNLLQSKYYKKLLISDIPVWSGLYQNDT